MGDCWGGPINHLKNGAMSQLHIIACTHGHTYPILMFNHFLYNNVLILDVNYGGLCLHFSSHQCGAKNDTKVAGFHQINVGQLSDSLVKIREG